MVRMIACSGSRLGNERHARRRSDAQHCSLAHRKSLIIERDYERDDERDLLKHYEMPQT